jgi:hypothetical protein
MAIFKEKKEVFTKNIFVNKNLTFPDIIMKNLIFPKFDLRKTFGEYNLKKYNKIFNLLTSLNYIFALSRYRNLF